MVLTAQYGKVAGFRDILAMLTGITIDLRVYFRFLLDNLLHYLSIVHSGIVDVGVMSSIASGSKFA
jgi:hypothetical protein